MTLEELDRILPRIVDQGLPDGSEFLFADLADDTRTAELVALLVWHGFLPMCGMGMLLPKIHQFRCVMNPEELHVCKKARKRARGYHMTVDIAWDHVVQSIQEYTFTSHPGDCWLSDVMAHVYAGVGQVRSRWRRGGVRFHSVELWHTESGELVAGEIGYVCGSVYSSATGFSKKEKFPGAGNVQLSALGRWLQRSGFTLWDLGMELPYKRELGGKVVPRSEWARLVRATREREVRLISPSGDQASAPVLMSGAEGLD